MNRLLSIVSGWYLLSVCFFAANALEQDFFPLAVGNWWEFETRTKLIERWELTGLDSNAFIFNIVHKGPDFTKKLLLTPNDENGWINTPLGRNEGGFWTPQAMLPGTDTLVTLWGTVENSRHFSVFWGHPNGINMSCISAPGIGPVGYCYNGLGKTGMGTDTVALLTDYHLETVPATRSHSISGSARADTGLLVSWTEGSTAEVAAYDTGPSDAQWYTVSGYNPLTRSLRIYLADTASHPSDENPAMESYEHIFTIEHLDPDSSYRFKMYRVAYTTLPPDYLFIGYDSIQSLLLYDRPLVVDKVSAKTPAHYSVPETGFTVSGRTITIRNGPAGTRAPLSCTLFSIDGRCIARDHIGELRRIVNIVAPGAGVYLLRIRNGNGSYRTSRIVIAR